MPRAYRSIHQQLSLMQLVQNIPIAKVVALHDLNKALSCDRLAVMSQGKLIRIGMPQDVLVPQVLQDIFKVRVRELIDPEDGSRFLRFKSIEPSNQN